MESPVQSIVSQKHHQVYDSMGVYSIQAINVANIGYNFATVHETALFYIVKGTEILIRLCMAR